MPTPENISDPRPDQAPVTPAEKAAPVPATTTQSDLASNDGAGIRGDYGDASQTNGLEGGQQTDTELTGS